MRTKANLPAKRISRRVSALVTCRVAGYHEDTKTFVQTYIENHISYANAKKEWFRGQQMKESGVACDCFTCKREGGMQ